MAFSYNNIIDRSKNKDRESNKDFNNNIILISSNKKKSSQEDIDNMVNKTNEKIFDVIRHDNNMYFCDKNQGLIWNLETEVCGIITKNRNIWFEEEAKLEKQYLMDNKEFKQIINNYIN